MSPFTILLIGIIVVVGSILALRLHAFLALILAALTVATLTPTALLEQYAQQQVAEGKLSAKAADSLAIRSVGNRVADGFGGTCAKIGILIAMASIVGKCVLDSGSADRIVRTTLRWLGEARAALAFLSSGFLLGIPVFFDTVFYLMIPLGKAMRLRTGRNYLLYILTICAGTTMTHSLVPPTPGPLLVAAELNVPIGLMMLGGCIVGAITVLFAYFYAHWMNRRIDIPLRAGPDETIEQLQELADYDERLLPPFWLAVLPIVLPVVLIGGATVAEIAWSDVENASAAQQWLRGVLDQVGESNIAMTLAALIAIVTLVYVKRLGRPGLQRAITSSLISGGEIILITGAGGAFGSTLQQTGVAYEIQGLAQQWNIAILPLAFLVTTLIRTAQGSATVAMITAVGVLGPLASSGLSACHPLYIALAIGCGSKPVTWMNDSGFWVITKMSGMTESETLKTITPMTASMGVIGLLVVMAAAALFPLV